MSEYQYYEFQAIDRPLTKDEMAELRSLSSRAQITSSRFMNVYNFGSFRGDPLTLMKRYFDVFVYVANWGTRQLMLRLPRPVLEPESVAPFLVEHFVTLHTTDEYTVLEILTDPEEPEVVIDAEQWLPALLPLRADLADGDQRALYLLWLRFVQMDLIVEEGVKPRGSVAEDDADDEDEDDSDQDDDTDWDATVPDPTVEPPLPAGLGSLTAALDALAEFFAIDRDLIAVAAERSGPARGFRPSKDEWQHWLSTLPETEKDALLLEIATGEPARARALLQHRIRSSRAAEHQSAGSLTGGRTAGELRAAAARHALARRRAEAEQKARERQRRQREVAAARSAHLAALAGREAELWGRVDALLMVTQPKEYDQAVQLLLDLRDLAAPGPDADAFRQRVGQLRQQFARRPSLIERFDRAGLKG